MTNGFVISLKLKLGFSILSLWFLVAVILGWYLYFSITDVKKFVSDVETSITLYGSISRFGTMLTKNSVALKVNKSVYIA